MMKFLQNRSLLLATAAIGIFLDTLLIILSAIDLWDGSIQEWEDFRGQPVNSVLGFVFCLAVLLILILW
jgi:hypothetical protein